MNLIKKMLFICSIFSFSVQAKYEYQFCNPKAPETAPTERFEFNPDGLATDTLTGLQWMRCLAGQHWTGTSCDGEPLDLGWSAALVHADSFEYSSNSDWRIPNIKELTSIVELSCRTPSLNGEVFPNSWFSGYNERHWTSTTIYNQEDLIWTVHFINGMDFTTSFSSFEEKGLHFRLVRDAD